MSKYLNPKTVRAVGASFASFIIYTTIGKRFRAQLDRLFNLLADETSENWEYEKDGTRFFLIPLVRATKKLGALNENKLQAILKSHSIFAEVNYGTNARIAWQGSGAGKTPKRNYLRERQQRFKDEHKQIDREINQSMVISAWKLLNTWDTQDTRKLVYVIPSMFGNKKKVSIVSKAQCLDIVNKNATILTEWTNRYISLSEKINQLADTIASMENAIENADIAYLLENGIHSEDDYDIRMTQHDANMGKLISEYKQVKTQIERIQDGKALQNLPASDKVVIQGIDTTPTFYDELPNEQTYIQLVKHPRYDVIGFTWDDILYMSDGAGI